MVVQSAQFFKGVGADDSLLQHAYQCCAFINLGETSFYNVPLLNLLN